MNFSAINLTRRGIARVVVGLALMPAAVLHLPAFAGEDTDTRDFMTVSSLLTGGHPLDPVIGRRLFAALQHEDPEALINLRALASALPDHLTAEQKKQAIAIQSAWYLGTVGKTVVSFERALAFLPVADNLKPRSYAGGPPGFWARPPNQ